MILFQFFNILLVINLTTGAKLLSDLLTNDNELVLLNDITSSKNIISNTKSSFDFDSQSKSKIIVNILYKNHSKFNKKISHKNTVIYFISNKESKCANNLCRSNETCILNNNNKKDKKDYKCVNVNDTFKKKEMKINKRDILASKKYNCSQQSINLLKSNLVEKFKKIIYNKSQITYDATQMYCLKSISNGFKQLDLNNDLKLNLKEWSNLKSECASELFQQCDTDNDGFLLYGEICSCIDQPNCSFIRQETNSDELTFYITNLGLYLFDDNKNKLNSTNYLPLCDSNGYFLPLQCDKDVNCWCSDKYGSPIVNTFRKISQDSINCYENS